MTASFGGRDEFNIDAQVDSFLHRAREMGIPVEVDFDPSGKHDLVSGVRHFAASIQWVAPRLRALDNGGVQTEEPAPLKE